jgi:hypothetical protein
MKERFVSLIMVFVTFIFMALVCFHGYYQTGNLGQLIVGVALLLHLLTKIKELKHLWLRM